jgi:sugar fermentation stimulation protein A
MKYSTKPIPATLLSRSNRFLGIVNLDGRKTECYIPNPGRMNEFMVPGTKVYLISSKNTKRKTKYDLKILEYNGTLVSIDSRTPNYLLKEAIEQNKLPEFKEYSIERTEPIFHESRLDLKLRKNENTLYLEAKSCTLVEKRIAYFPDAPTKRGVRHMKTLSKALEHGRAAVCFIIQRNDATEWRPNINTDPDFTIAIKQAIKKGVEAYAYTCNVTLDEINIRNRIPIILE